MSLKPIFEKKVLGGIFAVYDKKPEFDFYEVRQTHSSIISINPCLEEADGMILTCEDKKPLCIKTADCLPIYLKGKKQVALIHAGWKGLYQKILLSPLIKSFKPEYAFIGPAICQAHYEVGSEFIDYFGKQNISSVNSKYYFNLVDVASDQLKTEYPTIIVESSKLCTYENPNLHSFRLNKTKERNYNIFINQ